MAYHTLSDLQSGRLTEAELIELTNDQPDGEDVVESVWLDRATEADAEIDGYLGTRYALPLSEVPTFVARISATLTVYHLYRRRYAGKIPAQVTADQERVMKMLREIADGRITLGVQPAAAPNDERTAKLVSQTRVFSRSSMEGF